MILWIIEWSSRLPTKFKQLPANLKIKSACKLNNTSLKSFQFMRLELTTETQQRNSQQKNRASQFVHLGWCQLRLIFRNFVPLYGSNSRHNCFWLKPRSLWTGLMRLNLFRNKKIITFYCLVPQGVFFYD